MRESRIRLLVLYAQYTDSLSYFDDWLDAFRGYQGFETRAVNIVATDATVLRAEIEDVDAIVLLHSTNGDTTEYH